MSIIKNLPVCDMRNYADAAAINEIEMIQNIALLILPTEASPDVMAALAKVEKKNIAVTISLSKEQRIHILNGNVELTDANFSKDGNSVVLANGDVIIHSLSEETRGGLIVNGVLLLHESLKRPNGLEILAHNGQIFYKDFTDSKVYGGDLIADEEFFSYLQPKTVLIIGQCLKLEENVQLETLKAKEPIFLVGDSAYCTSSLASYLRATAQVANDVKKLEQYEEDKNKQNMDNEDMGWLFH